MRRNASVLAGGVTIFTILAEGLNDRKSKKIFRDLTKAVSKNYRELQFLKMLCQFGRTCLGVSSSLGGIHFWMICPSDEAREDLRARCDEMREAFGQEITGDQHSAVKSHNLAGIKLSATTRDTDHKEMLYTLGK